MCIYIYIYTYVCMYVCMYIYIYNYKLGLKKLNKKDPSVISLSLYIYIHIHVNVLILDSNILRAWPQEAEQEGPLGRGDDAV